jgi:hypothetical protein
MEKEKKGDVLTNVSGLRCGCVKGIAIIAHTLVCAGTYGDS